METVEGDRVSLVGETAHIKGEKPNAPRYDPLMKPKERNEYPNLIFVCGACHKEIDDQPEKYTVEKLQKMKDDHEKWVRETLRDSIIQVTFSELETVSQYLITKHVPVEESYIIIPPKEKIKKNELSTSTERLITMALTQVKQVAKFIEGTPDIEFGERLRNGFVAEYERLRNEGLRGDLLFDQLVQFSSGGRGDAKLRAAGLTVLVYLFEKCEVFEK